jgi:hypothetical protein
MKNALARGESPVLARLESACRALAEAKTVRQVKDIRDKAQAIGQYLKQQKYCLDAQNDAAELKIRAERKLGELLARTPLHQGGRPAKNQCHDGNGFRLRELGVGPHDSERWQHIASVPERELEDHVRETRAVQRELTTAGVLRLAGARKRASLPTWGHRTGRLASIAAS